MVAELEGNFERFMVKVVSDLRNQWSGIMNEVHVFYGNWLEQYREFQDLLVWKSIASCAFCSSWTSSRWTFGQRFLSCRTGLTRLRSTTVVVKLTLKTASRWSGAVLVAPFPDVIEASHSCTTSDVGLVAQFDVDSE